MSYLYHFRLEVLLDEDNAILYSDIFKSLNSAVRASLCFDEWYFEEMALSFQITDTKTGHIFNNNDVQELRNIFLYGANFGRREL